MNLSYDQFWKGTAKGPFGFSRYQDREEGIRRWGFAIPNAEAITAIAAIGPVIEMGAGTGYWASLLVEAGAEVQAFDQHVPGTESENTYRFKNSPLHTNVLQGTEEALADSLARTLLLVWPCYDDPFANNCLKQFTGEYVAFVGESKGGCVADDDFFESLADRWEEMQRIAIPHWDGLHDALWIYRRKS